MNINLFINIYIDKIDARQKELEICFKKNVENALINKIYAFVEKEHYPYWLKKFPLSEKINYIQWEGRPTYNDYFSFTNNFDTDINIISNTDIYFDETLQIAKDFKWNNHCFALTRYDYHPETSFNGETYPERIEFLDRCDSQDSWIFYGAGKKVKYGDFPLGLRGCLSGETLISYNRGNRTGGRFIKLKDLYLKYNGIRNEWDLKLETNTFSLNLNTDRIFLNKIKNVIQSGIKECIKIFFDDGTSLILTKDHPVLMKDKKFKNAEKFLIGEVVLCKGDLKTIANLGKTKKKYKKRCVVYVKYHPFPEKKIVKGHKYERVRRYRLVYEANMNNMSYESFVDCLRKDKIKSKTLKYLPKEMEIHHKDDNSLNDVIDNLEVMTKENHARLHGLYRGFNFQYVSTKKIIKIKSVGKEMTYDIEMERPHNNFCANNILVHNCDNRIALELRQAGYNISNPSKSIRTIHFHNTQIHNYSTVGDEDLIPSPYLLLTPCFIEDLYNNETA